MSLWKVLLAGMMGGSVALCAIGARADTVVPLVTPNTTITLTNATGKTVTGNATFNGTGPIGTGTETVAYSIPAFGEVNMANPVTMPPSYAGSANALLTPDVDSSTSTKYADPIAHVFDCDNGNGHNAPAWNATERQNTLPLAGTLQSGDEQLTVGSGDQPCTFTITRYGPNGEGPFYSAPVHFAANGSNTNHISTLLGYTPARNSSIEVHFDGPSQANGRAALLYTDPATLDTRIEEMKRYTIPTDSVSVARAYVAKWLPPTSADTYLSYNEIRAMIHGDAGSAGTMRSYAIDLAMELYRDPAMQGEFANGDAMAQWLREQVDGDTNNGELCTSQDSYVWRGAFELIGFYGGVACTAVQDHPGIDGMLNVYNLMGNDALVKCVQTHPEWYGGVPSGFPDMNTDPTWGTLNRNEHLY